MHNNLIQTSGIPDPNETAHADSVLVAELATANTMLTTYLLRRTIPDARHGTPISPTEEHALADRLSAAADSLRLQAEHRDRGDRG